MKVKELIKQLEEINPNADIRLYFPYDIEEDHPEDLSSDEFTIFSYLDYDEPFIELFSTVDMNGNRQQEKWIMIDIFNFVMGVAILLIMAYFVWVITVINHGRKNKSKKFDKSNKKL